jgi:uncharacterized protein related to proFAR isomerase
MEANFTELKVHLAVVLTGGVRNLEDLLREIEKRPGVRVVYVRTSGGKLRITEEP